MQGKSRSRKPDWYRVGNKKAIKILRDYKSWQGLEPFIGRETTLSAAAKRSGMSLRKMYHFAQQLLTARLIRVTRKEARSGRSLKYYQAVASHFFIAFEDLDVTLEEDLELSHQALKTQAHRSAARHVQETFDKAQEDGSGVWGRVYGRTSETTFSQLSLASEKGWSKEKEVWQREDVAPFMIGVGVLQLSYEQVRTFRKLFNELDKKHLKSTGDKTYYINLTLVELEDN
jgi:hypothetical protein